MIFKPLDSIHIQTLNTNIFNTIKANPIGEAQCLDGKIILNYLTVLNILMKLLCEQTTPNCSTTLVFVLDY